MLKLTHRVHPALLILCWVALAIGLPHIAWPGQLLLAVCAAVALFCVKRPAVGEALWRMRWLSLAILLCAAWTVAGDPLWHSNWAPTRQGLGQGAMQVLRLWALVWLLRAIWLGLSADEVLVGLLFLAAPLRWLGVPLDRGILRLRLTLDEVERLFERPLPFNWASWRQALNAEPSATLPERALPSLSWRGSDTMLLCAGLIIWAGTGIAAG